MDDPSSSPTPPQGRPRVILVHILKNGVGTYCNKSILLRTSVLNHNKYNRLDEEGGSKIMGTILFPAFRRITSIPLSAVAGRIARLD